MSLLDWYYEEKQKNERIIDKSTGEISLAAKMAMANDQPLPRSFRIVEKKESLLPSQQRSGNRVPSRTLLVESSTLVADSLPLRSLEHQDILSEDEFLLSDLADEYIFWDELNDEDSPRVQGYEFIKEKDGEPVYRKLPVVERHAPAEIELFEDDCNLDSAPSKYSHINFVPPEAVRNAAARGLAIRKEQPKSNRGGLTNKEASKEGIGSGVQRAVNLKNGDPVSPKVIRQMKDFFTRFERLKYKHKSEPEGKVHQNWLNWGGDAGYSWAKKVVGQMEAADKSERKDAIARFNKKHNESLTEDSLLVDLRQDSAEPTYEWVEGYNRGDSWVPGYVRYYRDRKGTIAERIDAPKKNLKKEIIVNKLGDKQTVWKKRGVKKVSCPNGRCTNETVRALGGLIAEIEGVEKDIKTGTGVIDALRSSGKAVRSVEVEGKTEFPLGWFVRNNSEGRFYLFNGSHAMALIDGELIDTDPRGAIADKGWRRKISALEVSDKKNPQSPSTSSNSKKKVQLDAQEEELPIDLSIELSMQRGQPVIDEWIKLLGEEIGKEKSLEALLEKIPDLASRLSIEDFGEIMQEGNMLSHLLGLTEEDL